MFLPLAQFARLDESHQTTLLIFQRAFHVHIYRTKVLYRKQEKSLLESRFHNIYHELQGHLGLMDRAVVILPMLTFHHHNPIGIPCNFG